MRPEPLGMGVEFGGGDSCFPERWVQAISIGILAG